MKLSFDHNGLDIEAGMRRKPAAVMQAIDGTLRRGAGRIAREAKLNAPAAESTLINSIHSLRIAQADYLIRTGQEYAGYAEEGTGAGGNPTIQSLIDWINVKRITPRDPTMDTRDLAYVFQESIRRKGTPKQPFMRPAYEKVVDGLGHLIKQNVARALA